MSYSAILTSMEVGRFVTHFYSAHCPAEYATLEISPCKDKEAIKKIIPNNELSLMLKFYEVVIEPDHHNEELFDFLFKEWLAFYDLDKLFTKDE